ncbi:LysR family transcriptional regulator [Nocardia yamanashiensis]|uniref:LysR family transcriptional regulator n=1 Tax=Nocardia yamanashiensis TaxID=209247 RepID=UPI001E3D69AF|nr:LysR family transcriptional regulator [Nocardia yamanashiensis]UGT41330.1 LysR family transcriptional regulator [Nocardia yamanashiensis]
MGDGMLERHEIEVFLTLVEELHFGRTAGQLRLSTARVSQTVAKLERRLGVPLFERSSRRVAVTAAGRELYADLRPAWDRIGAAVRRTVDTARGRGGTLTVAFVDAATSQLVARAAELLRATLPDCTVRIRETQPAQVIPALRAGEADIALGTLPIDATDIRRGPVLVTEARLLAVPANHPLAQRDSITPAEAERTTALEQPAFATTTELLALVGAGQGTLPVGAHARRYHPRPDVAYLPVRDAPPIEWALLWLSSNETARIREFSSAAVTAAAPV